MSTSRLSLFALFALFLPAASAGIIGFNGPWAPVDGSGVFISPFQASGASDGRSLSASISPDHSVLTIDFINSSGAPGSLFLESNYSPLLPTGVIDYDWSITFDQSALWLFETNVATYLPAHDSLGFLPAGTYSGHATYSYTSGGYFSFGNVGFGEDALSAHAVLTNFVYTGEAGDTPEPATGALLLTGVVLLAWSRRCSRS